MALAPQHRTDERQAQEASPYCAAVSARGRAWEVPQSPVAPLKDLPKGVSAGAAAIAIQRGFSDLACFFAPTLKDSMPDPFVLKDMEEAVQRFCAAIETGESVAVLGDYDVDGATSTSLLLRWLRSVGHEQAMFYIPDRMKEGYGPNVGAIERLAAEGATLLIVVDSGTTSHDPLARARELGMDAIVIDHHEPDGRMPQAILVNPKRKDEDRSYEYLCTAGLVFLLLVAANRTLRKGSFFDGRSEPDLRELLGIVALGTVCDMVPLVGLNRAYVTVGLPRMGAVPGIQALCDATGETAFTAKTCGFVYGPCINAAGRIDDTRLGTLLLSSNDTEEARELAQRLAALNQERREMQRGMVEAAIKRGKEEGFADHPAIVMYDPSWHPGIVGLVASKVKDAFERPTVIVGENGKSSCRAPDGFDIGQAVIRAKEAGLLLAGGGHAAAAGLTVEPSRIDELRAFLAREAGGFIHPALKVDVIAPCGSIGVPEVYGMGRLGPFGQGNPEPRIALVGGFARKVFVMKGKHVKVLLSGPDGEAEAILFNCIGTPLGDALAGCQGRYVDLLGKVQIDTWGGPEKVQFRPLDAMIEVAPEE